MLDINVVRQNVVRQNVLSKTGLGKTALGEQTLGKTALGEQTLGETALGEQTLYPTRKTKRLVIGAKADLPTRKTDVQLGIFPPPIGSVF
jgi:hypothetical protein